jgi:hypothetical protein
MKKRTVMFEPGDLSERETQIIGMLVTLQIQVLRSHFTANGHELTKDQERHIDDDVVVIFTRTFPDLHFYVGEIDSPDMPPGPPWPA